MFDFQFYEIVGLFILEYGNRQNAQLQTTKTQQNLIFVSSYQY